MTDMEKTFSRCNLYKYTWATPDEKTHGQTHHVLKYKRWRSSIVNVWYFRTAEDVPVNLNVIGNGALYKDKRVELKFTYS
jgi:hypothetical protein